MSTERARQLRRNQTDAERKLWQALRNRQFRNTKFRRQVPIGPYIADFVCEEYRLVIEVDGGQHGRVEDKEYDEVRTRFLGDAGYRVLRFWNSDILGNLPGVLSNISLELDHPSPDATRRPLPKER